MKNTIIKLKQFLLLVSISLPLSFVSLGQATAFTDGQPYWSCNGQYQAASKTLFEGGVYRGVMRVFACNDGTYFTSASRNTRGWIYAKTTRTNLYSSYQDNSYYGYGVQTNRVSLRKGSCIVAGASAGTWAQVTLCWW